MTNTIKYLTVGGLVAMAATAFSIVVTSGTPNSATLAAQPFNGNHYTLRLPTAEQSGCKEYWIDCTTHQMYFTDPKGTVTEAGEATIIIDNSDERYLGYESVIEDLKDTYTPEEVKEIISDNYGIELNDDLTKVIGIDETAIEQHNNELIIPEGVTEIEWWGKEAVSFKNLQSVEKISLPSTIEKVPAGWKIENCPNLKEIDIGVSTIVGNEILTNCQSLEKIIIRSTVEKISDFAFASAFKDGQIQRTSNWTNLTIYCEDNGPKNGWGSKWNWSAYWEDFQGYQYATNWSVTF